MAEPQLDLTNPEALFDGPLPGLGSEVLGVTDPSFRARRPARPFTDPAGRQIEVTPRFTEEDVDRFLGLGWEDLKRAQIALSRAGLLPKTAVLGVPGDETKAAVRDVFSIANRVGFQGAGPGRGTPIKEAFYDTLKFVQRQTAETKAAGIGGGLGEASLPAPETVRQGVKQALIQQMGKAPDDIVEQMMAGYNSAYSSRLQGSVQPPTIDAFVAEQLEGNKDAQVFQGTGILDTFYDALDSGVPEPPLARSSF